MIRVNEEFSMEYSDEMGNLISEAAVAIGDCIKGMAPLEKYYAVQMVLEELETRITVYCVMNDLQKEMRSSGQNS